MKIPAMREESRLRPDTSQHPPPRNSDARMNGVLFLLSLSVLINYIDRSNLSIAAPLIKDELGISAWQLGKLLSTFLNSFENCCKRPLIL